MASHSADLRAAEDRCLIRESHFAFAGEVRGRLYQFPDLRNDAILLHGRERGDETGGEHAIDDDLLGGAGVRVWKTPFAKRAKSLGGKLPS